MFYIRDMAIKSVSIGRYALRQFLTTGLIGLGSWGLLWLVGSWWWQSSLLGHVVGFSVLAAILTATGFALLIPFSLDKLRLDPAVGAGPFATIIQDLLSVIIFLSVGSFLL
jgi:magnesium transporter